jgi:hypothetical protein
MGCGLIKEYSDICLQGTAKNLKHKRRFAATDYEPRCPEQNSDIAPLSVGCETYLRSNKPKNKEIHSENYFTLLTCFRKFTEDESRLEHKTIAQANSVITS